MDTSREIGAEAIPQRRVNVILSEAEALWLRDRLMEYTSREDETMFSLTAMRVLIDRIDRGLGWRGGGE